MGKIGYGKITITKATGGVGDVPIIHYEVLHDAEPEKTKPVPKYKKLGLKMLDKMKPYFPEGYKMVYPSQGMNNPINVLSMILKDAGVPLVEEFDAQVKYFADQCSEVVPPESIETEVGFTHQIVNQLLDYSGLDIVLGVKNGEAGLFTTNEWLESHDMEYTWQSKK